MLVDKGSEGLRERWFYECSHEAKLHPGQYVGLRNQGCTCYMNSLLQQLFMVPRLREAVLAARVKRRRLVPGYQIADAELVGHRVVVDGGGKGWMEGLVVGFEEGTGEHVIKYEGMGEKEKRVRMRLREGRMGKDSGTFRVIPPPTHCSLSAAQEIESAQRVLEQMQRTFCYLASSEKRFFDPRHLVEACKCLNLNYSVYQQNDASEFCDKLLDSLEAALKGTKHMDELEFGCFGGKLAYQKLPQGCEHRAEREEPFIKIELIIKGKESIEESLAAFVEGELMDGENQVECEGCNTKKPTVRRICLGALPNLLILHLKRFDLDFSTFETVKLNNRCAFPMRLNVKPYTREGLEEAERAKLLLEQVSISEPVSGTREGEGEGEVPSVLEEGEYDYELKGVVIHAGIAQGGHYYSYIKDRQRPDCWHKFDDEDVSDFDPAWLENQCFGGTFLKTTTTWNGMVSSVEQEKVHNALMLFYEKVLPRGAAVAGVASTDGEEKEEGGGRTWQEQGMEEEEGKEEKELCMWRQERRRRRRRWRKRMARRWMRGKLVPWT